jgi:hypothetical protein
VALIRTVISQKMIIIIVTAVETSNLTIFQYITLLNYTWTNPGIAAS